MAKVGVIDCDISNLTSIYNAFAYLEVDVEIVKSNNFDGFSHLVLPGVGSFYQGMKNLREKGIDKAINQYIEKDRPLLGICLGMQLLSKMGEEFGPTEGLGHIPGEVRKIKPLSTEYRLPHIGWNDIHFSRESSLWKDIPKDNPFYFIHSYAYTNIADDNITAYCDYGGEVVAAVEKGNVYGLQFHPEKSQKYGLKILRNFIELC